MKIGKNGMFQQHITCPYRKCNHTFLVDLLEFDDGSESSVYERDGMGAEILYHIDTEVICPSCNRRFQATGTLSEYPAGAFNHADIHSKCNEEDDPQD